MNAKRGNNTILLKDLAPLIKKWYLQGHLKLKLMISLMELYYHFNARFNSISGVSKKKREIPVIVSLTTIPERINKVYLCIETLLEQSFKSDQIYLWLSDEIAEKDIPSKLKKLKKRGLQIRFCKDIRSYKKIIYTLMENPQSIIVTADDDVLYPRYWLKRLYEAYRKEPEYIHCHRAHLMERHPDGKLKRYNDWHWLSPGVQGPSFLLFPTTGSGVLFPPGSLHREVFNKELFMHICPTNDDVWLKAMSLLKRVPCKKVTPKSMPIYNIIGTQKTNLWTTNRKQINNISNIDKQIEAVFVYYNLHKLL